MLAGYAGRLVSPDRMGRAVTIALVGGTSSVVVGVPLGTAIGVAAGWRVPFAGFAVVAVVLAFIAARWLPRMAGTAGGPGCACATSCASPPWSPSSPRTA
jgi:predicted MFS family arabinose efflux permease